MKYFQLHVYSAGIEVSLIAVKNDAKFFQAIARGVYKSIPGVQCSVQIGNEGVVIESQSVPEGFLGSVIPFVYLNRPLELRVMDTYWEK